MEGKYWVKTWTAIMVEICLPGTTNVKLVHEDSRKIEGGKFAEREGERENEREINDK